MGLPSLEAAFDVRAIDRAFGALEEAIDEELDGVFVRAAEQTAQMTKAIHPWENRTGTLEGSIEALKPTGSALAGTLQGGVVMGAPYATYLEGGPVGPGIGDGKWQSLNPAWELIRPYWERDSQEALDRAVAIAGLK